MSNSVFGYKPARYDSEEPKNLYQVECLPPLRRPHGDMRHKSTLLYNSQNYAEDNQLEEYLDFVSKFMKEQAMNASGPLLVGGHGGEEMAIKVLQQYSKHPK